jgi:TatD DNase family protein
MFDSHCHLNFSVFERRVAEVIKQAKKDGVDYFVVPGTDIETSKKAIEIAEKYKGVYAAVGIHPHNVYEYQISNNKYQKDTSNIKNLLESKKTVAIGEIGLDRHIYQKTKYENYKVDEKLFELQKYFFIEQLNLARKYKKSVIIHNRQAKEDLLKILNDHWNNYFSGRMVFHCCEPDFVGTGRDLSLLDFAKKKKIFIGVDGDVVYNKKKQEFVKKIPLDLLVLETDSPYLSPFKKFPNEPKNLPLIAQFISNTLFVSINPPSSLDYRSRLRRASQLIKITTENGKRLFLE